MNRHVLVLAAALLSLTACGNTELTARGEVTATLDGATTGFNFEQDTRLETPMRDAALGLITGDCEMGRVFGVDGVPAWGLVVEIRRGSEVDDLGLASVTIMQRTETPVNEGRIEVMLGATEFTSPVDACAVEILYAEPDGGMVGLSGNCDVFNSGRDAATVAVDLDIVGCTVVE